MNLGHGEKRTRKQEEAIAALLSEATIQAVATKAGISQSTLKRWLAEPGFREAYRQARSQVVESAINPLIRSGRSAVATLVKNLSCGQAGVEVRAAQVLLEHVFALRGKDLEERLQELEETVAAIAQATNQR
jgi:hypothetical protein